MTCSSFFKTCIVDHLDYALKSLKPITLRYFNPSISLQQGLLEVMYDIFRLPVPVATQDFIEALLSVGECYRCLIDVRLFLDFYHIQCEITLTRMTWCVTDPSRFQDTWRLSDGFVASEAKIILPHRARSR